MPGAKPIMVKEAIVLSPLNAAVGTCWISQPISKVIDIVPSCPLQIVDGKSRQLRPILPKTTQPISEISQPIKLKNGSESNRKAKRSAIRKTFRKSLSQKIVLNSNTSNIPSRLTSDVLAVNQTPTPTLLIQNCEAVGLFDDLKKVNPFEETFRKAVECKSIIKNGLGNPTSVAENFMSDPYQSEDSLHTPCIPCSITESVSANKTEQTTTNRLPINVNTTDRSNTTTLNSAQIKERLRANLMKQTSHNDFIGNRSSSIENIVSSRGNRETEIENNDQNLKNNKHDFTMPKSITRKDFHNAASKRYRDKIRMEYIRLKCDNEKLVIENKRLELENTLLKKILLNCSTCKKSI